MSQSLVRIDGRQFFYTPANLTPYATFLKREYHGDGEYQTFLSGGQHMARFMQAMARDLQQCDEVVFGPAAKLVHAAVIGRHFDEPPELHARSTAALARVSIETLLRQYPDSEALALAQEAVENFGLRYRPFSTWECDEEGYLRYRPENAEYYVDLSATDLHVDAGDIVGLVTGEAVYGESLYYPVLRQDTDIPALQEGLAKVEYERRQAALRAVLHQTLPVQEGLPFYFDGVAKVLAGKMCWKGLSGRIDRVELCGTQDTVYVVRFVWRKGDDCPHLHHQCWDEWHERLQRTLVERCTDFMTVAHVHRLVEDVTVVREIPELLIGTREVGFTFPFRLFPPKLPATLNLHDLLATEV
jgi:hypothetical protein